MYEIIFYRFYHNICDNLTAVERTFDILESRHGEAFNENQTYVAIFNKTFQCRKTANTISKDRLSRRSENATGTLHSENCTGSEKNLASILNLEGLAWVRICVAIIL